MDIPFSELRERTGLSIKEIASITDVTERTVYRWENGEITPRSYVFEKLQKLSEADRVYRSDSERFTFIDLFAGIGGLRLGFESIGGKCVFTSEINKFARQTYASNFSCSHPFNDDITSIEPQDIPKHDVLLAGFPCQPFSIAGVSKKNSLGVAHGFADKTQGTLFFDIARILEYHQPRAFLLENVKNLERHDKGKTFQVIRETLFELGYHFDWRVIDAKGFVPQHRERIFIAGFRENNGFSFNDYYYPDPDKGPKLESILHPEDGSEDPEPPYTVGNKALVADKYTLSDKLWKYLQDYAAKHKARGNGFGYGLVGRNDTARTLSARYYKDGSEILIKQKVGNPRRLTPRECSRLMGFDTSSRIFEIPVSDTQAYRQFGNAVVVPVVESVAEYLEPYIMEDPLGVDGQLELELRQNT